MTGEIIIFRNHLASKQKRDIAMPNASPNLSELAERIREELRKKPIVGALNQRIILAKNLWQILEDLEAKGTRKKSVVDRASLGSKESSTKSLYNYTLDPTTTDLNSLNLERRLIKKASKYERIIDAAASISGQSRDFLLARFVEGSEYDVRLSLEARFNDNDAYNDIASFLIELGIRLEKKYHLSDYYRYLGARRIWYNDTASEFSDADQMTSVLRDAHSEGLWQSLFSVLRYGPFLHLYDYNVLDFVTAEYTCINELDNSLVSEGKLDVHLCKRVFLGHLPIGVSGEAELCFVEEHHTDMSGISASETNWMT